MKKIILIFALLAVGCSSDDGCECAAYVLNVNQTENQFNFPVWEYKLWSDCDKNLQGVGFNHESNEQRHQVGECLERRQLDYYLSL